jgi:hypothetical protein
MKINIFNCHGKNKEIINHATPPDFYIGRPSLLGNPFVISIDGDRDEVVKKYERWLMDKCKHNGKIWKEIMRMKKSLKEFGIVNLWCWCSPSLCHGNVIKKILEGRI